MEKLIQLTLFDEDQEWMGRASKYQIDGAPPNLKNGCWLTSQDFGENRICATKECINADGKAICTECIRYIHFYGKVEELEQSGIRFGEAVRIVKTG